MFVLYINVYEHIFISARMYASSHSKSQHIYIFIYSHIYTYFILIYAYMYVCIHTRTHIHLYLHISFQARVMAPRTNADFCKILFSAWTNLQVCTHAHRHTHAHAHTHTSKYTHKHISHTRCFSRSILSVSCAPVRSIFAALFLSRFLSLLQAHLHTRTQTHTHASNIHVRMHMRWLRLVGSLKL